MFIYTREIRKVITIYELRNSSGGGNDSNQGSGSGDDGGSDQDPNQASGLDDQQGNVDDKESISESQQGVSDYNKGSISEDQDENNPYNKIIISLKRVETPELRSKKEENEKHMKRFKNFDDDYMNKCKEELNDLRFKLETKIKTQEEREVKVKKEKELLKKKKRKEKLDKLLKEITPKDKINYKDIKKSLKKVSRQ